LLAPAARDSFVKLVELAVRPPTTMGKAKNISEDYNAPPNGATKVLAPSESTEDGATRVNWQRGCARANLTELLLVGEMGGLRHPHLTKHTVSFGFVNEVIQ
jgi:hypothetical protein